MNRKILLLIAEKHLTAYVDRFEMHDYVISEIDCYKDYDEYFEKHKYYSAKYLLTREEWEQLDKWLKE